MSSVALPEMGRVSADTAQMINRQMEPMALTETKA